MENEKKIQVKIFVKTWELFLKYVLAEYCVGREPENFCCKGNVNYYLDNNGEMGFFSVGDKKYCLRLAEVSEFCFNSMKNDGE